MMKKLLMIAACAALLAMQAAAKGKTVECVPGREAASVRALQKEAKMRPDSSEALITLGHCRFLAGDVLGAKADLREAARLDALDTSKKSRLLSAILLLHGANIIGARVDLDRAKERDLAAARFKGLAGQRGPEAETERTGLAAWLKDNPEMSAAKRREALEEITRGRGFAQLVVDALPDNPDGHDTLSSIDSWLNSKDEALVSANRAVELAPASFFIRLQRAGILAQLGRDKEALADYDAAYPLADESWRRLVYTSRWPLLKNLGLDARLKDDLNEMIKERPLEPEAYTARADVHAREKNWAAAAEDWLEGRRLWAARYDQLNSRRADDQDVTRIAKQMSLAETVGMDPLLAATMLVEGYMIVEPPSPPKPKH